MTAEEVTFVSELFEPALSTVTCSRSWTTFFSGELERLRSFTSLTEVSTSTFAVFGLPLLLLPPVKRSTTVSRLSSTFFVGDELLTLETLTSLYELPDSVVFAFVGVVVSDVFVGDGDRFVVGVVETLFGTASTFSFTGDADRLDVRTSEKVELDNSMPFGRVTVIS